MLLPMIMDIKRIIMFRPTKTVGIIFILFSVNAYSSNMYATLTGSSTPNWNTVVPIPEISGGIAPSYWDTKQPKATSEWYPGSLSGNETQTITFIDQEAGSQFVTEIEWKGVQYNMGSSSKSFDEVTSTDIGSGIAGSSCNTSMIHIPISTASQSGGLCASDHGFKTSGERVTPFQFIRPVINLPNLAEDIKDAPSGRYTAFTSYYPVYFYKSQSGIMTYSMLSEALFVHLDYTAAYFIDAVKIGNGVITPKYDKENKKVSGQTDYEINVSGLFPDGVRMTFSNDSYEMIAGTESEKVLPYSIVCSIGCGNRDIVINGKLANDIPDGKVITTAKTTSEGVVNVKLDISYEAKADDVISDQYNGVFLVIFEANL